MRAPKAFIVLLTWHGMSCYDKIAGAGSAFPLMCRSSRLTRASGDAELAPPRRRRWLRVKQPACNVRQRLQTLDLLRGPC